MPLGITNTTVITMNNLTYISNSSDIAEFMVRGNEVMFGGIGFFVLLLTAWVILFLAAYWKDKDYPLHCAMYSGAVITVVSLFIRGIEVSVYGVTRGLLTDHLLWIFPLSTILIAVFLYMNRD